jgi:hypothetical protein
MYDRAIPVFCFLLILTVVKVFDNFKLDTVYITSSFWDVPNKFRDVPKKFWYIPKKPGNADKKLVNLPRT